MSRSNVTRYTAVYRAREVIKRRSPVCHHDVAHIAAFVAVMLIPGWLAHPTFKHMNRRDDPGKAFLNYVNNHREM